MEDPVVDQIVAHVERVEAHGVPGGAAESAKAVIADTLAVGIAGLATPERGKILEMLLALGGIAEATVFGSGERLPLIHAAMLNAYQIHGRVAVRDDRESAGERATGARQPRAATLA